MSRVKDCDVFQDFICLGGKTKTVMSGGKVSVERGSLWILQFWGHRYSKGISNLYALLSLHL